METQAASAALLSSNCLASQMADSVTCTSCCTSPCRVAYAREALAEVTALKASAAQQQMDLHEMT